MGVIVNNWVCVLPLVDILDGSIHILVENFSFVIDDLIVVLLESFLHASLSLFVESSDCLTALVPEAGHGTLESRGLCENLVNLILGLDAENLLELVCRAGVDIGEERDLLALHEGLQSNHVINISLTELGGQGVFACLDI